MKVMKNAIKATLGILFLATAVFAQSLDDARVAIDAEQYQKAKTILKSLTASKPAEAENYFYLGNVYLIQEYPDSAKTAYNKGIAADAEFPLNYVGLGAVDLADGNAGAAKANFDKAVALDKRGYKANLYVGRAYIDSSKPNPAAAIPYLDLAKADKNGMKDALVFLALADANRKQGKNSEAYGHYRTAVEMNPKLTRAAVEQAVITKEARAFQEAVTAFNAVIAANPNYGPAYRELAETYYRWAGQGKEFDQTKIAEARKQYQKYMDLTDRSLESRLRMTTFMFLTRDYKSVEENAKAIAATPGANLLAYRYLGYAAFENANFPASVQALKNFVSKVQQSRIIGQDYMYLGRAQLRTSEPQEGYANIEKAISMDSSLVDITSQMGIALFREKKYADAAKILELAVDNPNSKTVATDNFYLAYSYYFNYVNDSTKTEEDKAQLVRADTALAKVITISPNTESAYLYRARIGRVLDDAESSKGLMVPHYDKYIEVVLAKGGTVDETTKRNLIEAYNLVGAYYAKKENFDKAKEYFNKSIALDPMANDGYAEKTLKIITGGK